MARFVWTDQIKLKKTLNIYICPILTCQGLYQDRKVNANVILN
jgi:hypothetical protein